MSIEGFLWVWRCRCGRQQLYEPTEALASGPILAKVLNSITEKSVGSFLVILQVRYQVFHRVAPAGSEQPHYTDTVWVMLL
jgi:hypothetical protein